MSSFTATLKRTITSLAYASLRFFGVAPTPAVFILGHMRSGSTLLLHILLTSSEMIGCGERNAAYKSDDDLAKLELAARIAQRAPLRRVRYVVDQLNHDHLLPNTELLQNRGVRVIFLIREPYQTIESIIRLTRTFYEPWSVQRAVEYYCRRLHTLAGYGSRLDRTEYLALTHGSLINETSQTLRRIESFLKLEVKLHEDYTIQTFTGKRGDPSPRIRSGRILRDTPAPAAEIEDTDLGEAVRAYEACALSLGLSCVLPDRIQNAK